jgi:hypothetical protein
VLAGQATAQQWHSGADIELIRRAVAHRTARDADTLLAAWQAEAHGFLRFASVLDHGNGPVERVIRLDELRVEVYGEAPNRSKQIIVGWRDTTFLPNRMVYHRDHLGIVANDFGATIRLGQGDEVRDVAHPLSEGGMGRYLFAVGDTTTLTSASGRVRVVSVQVRPIDADSSGAVGTLYLDIDRAALVRFRFTFTPASYRDPTVEMIAVTLDNALQQQARWLPWHQSIVIRRGEPVIDLPFRTVIRADWTIDHYQLGVHHPADRFAGAPLVGPRDPSPAGIWPGPIGAGLDLLPATDADVASIASRASAALNGRLLDGLPRLRLAGSGVSDFLRINRVEGITPAAGLRLAIGNSVVMRGRIGIGLSDHRTIGEATIAHVSGGQEWSLAAGRAMVDISDTPVISGVSNSLSTLFSGDDRGDYTLVEGVGIAHNLIRSDLQWRVEGRREWSWDVATAFTALSGVAAGNPALGAGAAWVARSTLSRRDAHGHGWTIDAEAGQRARPWYRARAAFAGQARLPAGSLQFRGDAGIGWGTLPGYRSFVLGGEGTLLGVPFRSLGGRRMALGEIAWALPIAVPTPPLPYSHLLRLPSVMAPYVAAGSAGGDIAALPWRGTATIEPVAGLRLDLWGPLLRIESGISLRTGHVAFAFDVHPDWWPVL